MTYVTCSDWLKIHVMILVSKSTVNFIAIVTDQTCLKSSDWTVGKNTNYVIHFLSSEWKFFNLEAFRVSPLPQKNNRGSECKTGTQRHSDIDIHDQ